MARFARDQNNGAGHFARPVGGARLSV